jgi:osmoprotectant transport system permease protein
LSALGQAIHWFADPAHWSGPQGIPSRLLEHVQISALTTAVAAAVAIPIGLYLGHTGRGRFVVLAAGNLGRAIPSFALMALAFPITIKLGLGGLGYWPTVVALVALGIPPMLTNSYTGVAEVDADLVDAANGMGLSGSQVLLRIQMPLAAPLVMAGLRTAAVQIVATASLAAVIAGGGLGRFIIDGFAIRDTAQIIGGAVLVAALAIVTELAFGGVQRLVTPRTSSTRKAGSLPPGPQPAPGGLAMDLSVG